MVLLPGSFSGLGLVISSVMSICRSVSVAACSSLVAGFFMAARFILVTGLAKHFHIFIVVV